jgi:tol-pal system protein YbgF
VISLFWLGNSQYANREYKEAIKNFNNLLTKDPEHTRAPDAMLSIANCQLEMKDVKSARKTLEDVMKKYPQSESAAAAKERLAKLK